MQGPGGGAFQVDFPLKEMMLGGTTALIKKLNEREKENFKLLKLFK